MSKPIPPARPVKPIAPDKNKKFYINKLDVDSLFFKRTYYMDYSYEDDPVAVSKEQFKYGKGYIDTEHQSPSLADIINLVPKGIPLDQIHLEIDTSPSESFDTFEGVEMYYTTPYDYESELKKYNTALAQYEVDKEKYQKVLYPKYKRDLAAYQKIKDQERLLKQEAALKEQLAAIEKKKKVK